MSTLLLAVLVLAAQPSATDEPGPDPAQAPVADPASAGQAAEAAVEPQSPEPGSGEDSAAEPVAYPLGTIGVPDFAAPGEPLALTDLAYGLADDGGTEQTLRARVRYRDLAYIGTEVAGERRGLSVMTHRLSLSAFAADGAWDFGAEFRGRRFVAGTSAVRRAWPDRTWRVAPSLAVRPFGALEVEGWLVSDSARPADRRACRDRPRCEGRVLTSFGGDVFWQRGAGLELLAGFARRYELTSTQDENRIDTGQLRGVAQLGRLELRAGYLLDDVVGRFSRRESEGSLEARVPLAGRLLLEGSARNRFDHGLGELGHEYGGGVAWFGRRVTLPRSGRAARQADLLARQARASGEYEFGAFDEDSLRAQRERLSLSREREAFRPAAEAVHRAQVEERLVPLLGLSYRHSEDGLSGERVHTARALVGVPWPPALPWRAREGCSPFVLLEVEHRWHTTGPDLASGTNAVALTLALSREMSLVGRWTRSGATALDILRGIARREHIEISYVYARGR